MLHLAPGYLERYKNVTENDMIRFGVVDKSVSPTV